MGCAAHQLLRIPEELGKILAMENPEGSHKIQLVFKMPEGFVEQFRDALQQAVRR
jgi:hypothetical protein